jgi:hypothetical protein
MKIRVKNIKGEIFSVDIEASNTIGQLKELICATRAEYASQAPNMRLIFNGAVLEDNSSSVGAYNLKETDFFVCMVKKPASATAAAPVAQASPEKKAPVAPAAAVTTTAPAVTSPAATARSESLANLVAMTGLPEQVCLQAFEAANGDPNLAFDFLSGYAPAPRAQPRSQAVAKAPSPLDKIRQHPQFEMLKEIIRQNPAAINQVKSIIQQSDPELFAAINANPAEFEAVMTAPSGGAVMPPQPPAGHTHNFEFVEGGDEGEDYMDDDGDEMVMTEAELDDMAAHMGITREQLMDAMGVSAGHENEELTEEDEVAIQDIMDQTNCAREDVIDCYLDCHKDLDMTIQTLMNEMMDGDDDEEFEGDFDES